MAVCGTGVPVVGVTGADPICSASGALGTNAFNSTTIPAAQVAANLASSGSTGVTGQLPIGQVGSAGLSGGSGVGIASTGAITLNAQYRTWSDSDGLVSTAALGTTATPNVVFGVNGSGVNQTITTITCFVDAGSGTVFTLTDGTNNLLGATGTCSTSGASILVSVSHNTINSGGHMVYTITPDSTAKAVTLAVSGIY